MAIALIRPVSPAMNRCELTYAPRVEIDIERAVAQHHLYAQALAAAGCHVVSLPPEPDLPDSVFVEDAAVVLYELAVITRPGAESRRPETRSVSDALRQYRTLYAIESPGTLDGGDVLCVDKTIYVGISTRSNQNGIDQLAAATAPFGYHVVPIRVDGCLHLKSAVTRVNQTTLLLNPDWVDRTLFPAMEFIDVNPAEPAAANSLRIGDKVIYPASCVRTRLRLQARGVDIVPVDVSEIEKAEGGVTCCSLIVS
jgi:dimethylargininase